MCFRAKGHSMQHYRDIFVIKTWQLKSDIKIMATDIFYRKFYWTLVNLAYTMPCKEMCCPSAQPIIIMLVVKCLLLRELWVNYFI